MTFDQIVGLLVTRLGNRPHLREKVEFEIIDVMENVIEKEPDFKPWFLLQDDLDVVAFTSGVAYVALPSDYLAPYEYGFAYLENTSGQVLPNPLCYRDYDKLRSRNADGDDAQVTGDPTHYAIKGNRLYLAPTPNRSGNIHLNMYAKQAVITSKTAATHPVLAHASDWLMNEVGARLAQNAQNPKQMAIFMANAGAARLRVWADTNDRLQISQTGGKGGEI